MCFWNFVLHVLENMISLKYETLRIKPTSLHFFFQSLGVHLELYGVRDGLQSMGKAGVWLLENHTVEILIRSKCDFLNLTNQIHDVTFNQLNG